ncbi:MAG: hypothetical protein ABIJ09_15000 [Pseudomonadota bacterium]
MRLVLASQVGTGLLTGCENENLVAWSGPEPPLSPVRDGGDHSEVEDREAPGPCEFISMGQTLGIDQFEWAAQTDELGLVLELHETRRPYWPVAEAEVYYGVFDLLTRYQYDALGRVTRVVRVRSDDDQVYESEELAYRDDGGIASHLAESGPAWELRWGQRYRLWEMRRVEAGVELIDEERTSLDLASGTRVGESRRMHLGPDGDVIEEVDLGADGEVDHRVRHLTAHHEDGSETVLSELLLGEESQDIAAWRSTEFGADGIPRSQDMDHNGDGSWLQSMVWYTWNDETRHANIFNRNAHGDLSSRLDAIWQRQGAVQRYVNSEDSWADGELDWMQEVQFYGGLLTMNNQITEGATMIWNYPVHATCPDVLPRLELPSFRRHCPLRRFSTCLLHDAWLPFIPAP